jgi:hypothetical protein
MNNMATPKSASQKLSEKSTKKAAASKKAKLANAKSASLGDWLGTFHENAKAVVAAGEPVGACLVTDPHTGTETCLLVDQKTCKALKGTFMGGPCGGG